MTQLPSSVYKDASLNYARHSVTHTLSTHLQKQKSVYHPDIIINLSRKGMLRITSHDSHSNLAHIYS